MADVSELFLTKLLPALGTGVVSAFGTVWKFTRSITKRIDKLEQELKGIRTTISLSLESEKRAREDGFKGAERAWEAKDEDVRGYAQRVSTVARSRYEKLEARVVLCERAAAELNESLDSFMKEQSEQWQAMQRTLGRIEGHLKTTPNRSGEYPGSKK